MDQQQVRRLSDGFIDFEFYRRRAAYERSVVMRLLMRRCLSLIYGVLRGAVSLTTSGLPVPARRRAPERLLTPVAHRR